MKRNACQKCAFAVRDDNPHCGLRGFTNDFNVEYCSAEGDTIPNGYELQEDGYFSWVDKKKEYPKTYEECCELLDGCSYNIMFDRCETAYEEFLHNKLLALRKLIICRDAYWKIAGEEMGLGKPWEPDFTNDDEERYGIYTAANKVVNDFCGVGDVNTILTFPTEEMRDAFYEAFRNEIEFCKEFL